MWLETLHSYTVAASRQEQLSLVRRKSSPFMLMEASLTVESHSLCQCYPILSINAMCDSSVDLDYAWSRVINLLQTTCWYPWIMSAECSRVTNLLQSTYLHPGIMNAESYAWRRVTNHLQTTCSYPGIMSAESYAWSPVTNLSQTITCIQRLWVLRATIWRITIGTSLAVIVMKHLCGLKLWRNVLCLILWLYTVEWSCKLSSIFESLLQSMSWSIGAQWSCNDLGILCSTAAVMEN